MNPDEILIEEEMDDVVAPLVKKVTQFLALDKCLPNRQFLEIIDIPSEGVNDEGPRFSLDPEWLAITRSFHSYLSTNRMQPLPELSEAASSVKAGLQWIKDNVGERSVAEIQTFCQTAASPDFEGPNKNQQRESPEKIVIVRLIEVLSSPVVYESPDGSFLFASTDREQNKPRADSARSITRRRE